LAVKSDHVNQSPAMRGFFVYEMTFISSQTKKGNLL